MEYGALSSLRHVDWDRAPFSDKRLQWPFFLIISHYLSSPLSEMCSFKGVSRNPLFCNATMKQHLPPPLPFLRELKITETVYEHDLQLDLGHIVARVGMLESEVEYRLL